MKLIHSEQLLNQSSYKTLPAGTYRGLVCVYSGQNASGKDTLVTNLGRIRVSFKGTDTHNTDVDLLSKFDNVEFGFPQASNSTGGAFSYAIYVPFHAPWDKNGGAYFGEGSTYVQADFPFFTTTQIASGTFEVYAISANEVASYTSLLLQRNVQSGGAGTVAQVLDVRNVSATYIAVNSSASSYIISADNVVFVNASSNALQYATNILSVTEADAGVLKANLNPFNRIDSNLNRQVSFQATTTAATQIRQLVLAFAFSESMISESIKRKTETVEADVAM